MTVAMRAVSTSEAERVLRVGRVEGGRVVEERIFRRGAEVTVGTHHGCSFVVAAATAPERATLFSCDSAGWSMLNDDRVEGRVAIASGVTDMRQLRALARSTGARAPIGEDGRGKIVFAGATFLFQLVAAPPVQSKPQLPLTVRSRAGQSVDWVFTMVAAASFLAHFGLAGLANSDALDPTVDDEAEVATLILDHANRPEIEPESPATTQPATTVAKNEPTPAKPTTPKAGVQSNPRGGHGEPKPRTTADPSALGRDLASLSVDALGVFDRHAPATIAVATQSTKPSDSAFDEIWKRGGSIDARDPGMRTGRETGPMLPGGDSHCLGCAPDTRAPTAAPTPAPTADGPKVPMPMPGPIEGPAPKGVDSVVARLRYKFRACLTRDLVDNPDGGGTIRVRVKIGETGDVAGTSIDSTTASPTLTSCVSSAFSSAKFDAPDNGAVSIVVPIVLKAK